MNFNKKLFLLLVFVFLTTFSFSQKNENKSVRSTVPGNIKLLPGYVHTEERGTDTWEGKISKEHGLTITYDIGRLAGNYAQGSALRDKQELVWSKTQRVDNQDLILTHLKDGTIYATFPESYANFISNVKTDEELADFLLMIVTFKKLKIEF